MNPVNQTTNRFCGPAVLSIITGIDTGEAERLIQDVRHTSRSIKGAYLHELCTILQQRGYKTEYLNYLEKTVFRFLFEEKRDGTYLVTVSGHFVCFERENNDWKVCDNHTKTPLKASRSARLMQKIISVIRVELKK